MIFMRFDKAGRKDKGLAGLILLTLVNVWCRRDESNTRPSHYELGLSFSNKGLLRFNKVFLSSILVENSG
jgi:hypothetical protein